MGEDERELAELGYKQELHRGWSSFTNFAISFTHLCLSRAGDELLVRLERGGPSRNLHRVADPVRLRAARRVLDGGADLGVPDCGWPVLVAGQARQPGLELDHRGG